ncbi:hypothetical protein CTAYLR_006250 [Chrysophaeum taylorii]|uniref:GrpE protein homolog n=1 Tax=Chrysophaeum taylorii TaxID=2483200 RepID=A0AAD7UIH1_9STRA|nr:hypothetical protein CTAYLR_006250 [Chrysophaeum taylorii]
MLVGLLSVAVAWSHVARMPTRRVEVYSEATEVDEVSSSLKERISELEDVVRTKRLAFEDARDAASDAGKSGYLRLAAQIEDYRRASKGSAAMSVERTKVAVFKALLPVVQGFEVALAIDPETPIQKNYAEVYRSLMVALTGSGLDEFHAVVGETFDAARHEADETPTGPATVLAELRPGFKVQATGDIIRPAKCTIEIIQPQEEEKQEKLDDDDDDEKGEEGTAAAAAA